MTEKNYVCRDLAKAILTNQFILHTYGVPGKVFVYLLEAKLCHSQNNALNNLTLNSRVA